MRLIDADEIKRIISKSVSEYSGEYSTDMINMWGLFTQIIDNAPTVELTASFMRQQAEDELIRIRAEADQRGYQRGYNWGLEIGQNLKRPTGEWKITDAYPHKVYCDKCYKSYAQENWEVWKDGSLPRDFCPNCGAKMKGADND